MLQFALHGWSEWRLALRTVDAADGHLVHPELARRFRDDRFDDDNPLQAAGRALRTPWRCIRQHRHPAPAHGLRLIQQRHHAAGCRGIALCVVGTVIGDHEHVEGRDPPLSGEADFHSALKTGPRASDESLLLAADAHHHRGVGLFRQERRDNHRDATGYLAAESAACIFANEDNFARIHIQPSREHRLGLSSALRARVNVDLAVLPVSHRTAGLEGLMAGVWRDERFVKHECGVLEARVEVAIRPCVGRLAHRQTALLVLSEVRLGPLEFRDLGLWRILWPRLHPDVAVGARVRPTRTQRVERIDDERQRLKINANLFDRCRGGEFVDRGHGENRFALVERLIGEPPFAPLAGFDHRAVVGEGIGRSGNVVCR